MQQSRQSAFFIFILSCFWSIFVHAGSVAPKQTTLINAIAPYPAPAITGIDSWINSPPLTLSALKGKVVLIDFWSYSCINCIRTLPHLNDWYAKYKDQGLVIIGVHSPEFAFEQNSENVRRAINQ